jgi:hypothetical protein
VLQALAAVECNFGVGGRGGCPPGCCAHLVIITAGLADRTWPEAGAERSAAFNALYSTQLPPSLRS